MFSKIQQTLFDLLNREALAAGVELYLVGGIVRDALLGVDCADLDVDIVVAGNAVVFAEKLIQVTGGELKKFSQFYTAKIVDPIGLPGIAEIDLASSRTEIYQKPGGLPVVKLADIQQDLFRRDFSINALALELKLLSECLQLNGSQQSAKLRSTVIDLNNGLSDLDQKIIRVLHPSSFVDDPTRIFRAARYVQRLSANLAQQTQILLRQAVSSGHLLNISPQRCITEIKKVMQEQEPMAIFTLLEEWQVIKSLCTLYDVASIALYQRLKSVEYDIQELKPNERFEAFVALTIGPLGRQNWRASWASFGIAHKVLAEIEKSFILAQNYILTSNLSFTAQDSLSRRAQIIMKVPEALAFWQK